MRKRCAVLAAAILTVGCLSQAERECERAVDCPDDEFCRMGFCVPAVAHDEVSIADAQADVRPPSRDGDDRRPRMDGADAASERPRDVDRCDGRAPESEDLAVNEILVDVPGGAEGDANGDGTRDAFDDEFVEIVNRAEATLDLSDVDLLVGGDVTATLDGICLTPREAVVVFGGGSPDALADSTDDALFRTADSRLGFSNSGGTFALRAPGGTLGAEVEWNGPPSESLTLQPQLEGSSLKPHSTVAPGQPFSPGRCADGGELSSGCPAPEMADAGDGDAPSDVRRADAKP